MERRPPPRGAAGIAAPEGRAARALAFLLLAAVTLLGVGGPAHAGDPQEARALLEAGKQAVSQRQYDAGVAKLREALAADEGVVEAHYWIAFAEEKRGNAEAALAAYRAFRDACKGCESELPKELRPLLRKTQTRLKALAPAETELAKLNDGFIEHALDLARRQALPDPFLARRAVDAVLAIDPRNAEACRLRTQLEKDETAGDRGPTQDVVKWEDVLRAELLGSPQMWTRIEGGIRIEDRGGHFIHTGGRYDVPRRYVYEIEGRFLAAYGKAYLGLCFGRSEDTRFHCDVGPGMVHLWQSDGVTNRYYVKHRIKPVKLKVWFRLSMAVEGNHVEVFLDGKKLFAHDVPKSQRLDGDVGIFHQDGRFEVRLLRMGARK